MSAALAVRMRKAKQAAEHLLKVEGLLEPLPVDPIALATKKGILVQPNPDEESGVSGMLLRHGNTFGIVYATYLQNQGFERFSVAHELGHYFLEGHVDHVFAHGDTHASRAGFVTADPFELEADSFAAGLLMPSLPIMRLLRRHDPGLGVVHQIANLFLVSRTASAIRYAELTKDAVAVVVSTAGRVDYCFISNSMKSLPNIDWIRKGSEVPNGTATASLLLRPGAVERGEQDEDETDVRTWLGGTLSRTVREEVLGLGRYGKVLTVLSSATIGQDEETDEEEDEDLIERWTPRFKR